MGIVFSEKSAVSGLALNKRLSLVFSLLAFISDFAFNLFSKWLLNIV